MELIILLDLNGLAQQQIQKWPCFLLELLKRTAVLKMEARVYPSFLQKFEYYFVFVSNSFKSIPILF